jgi:hypothetical protein
MDYNRMDLEKERSSVRDKVWAWDPRLLPAIAVVLILMMIDFFNRVVIFMPDASGQRVEEIATVSDAVPQIGQPHLDNYLLKLANLVKVPSYAEVGESINNVGDQQLLAEQVDGYWRSELFSLKLLAVAKSADRFAVIDRVNNGTRISELIELREGEMIDNYLVDQISQRQLQLRSDVGDIVNLILFEQNTVEGVVQ